jgi:hypothetical protein
MADDHADHSALRWLAQRLEWERVLTALREVRDGEQPVPRRERPAA